MDAVVAGLGGSIDDRRAAANLLQRMVRRELPGGLDPLRESFMGGPVRDHVAHVLGDTEDPRTCTDLLAAIGFARDRLLSHATWSDRTAPGDLDEWDRWVRPLALRHLDGEDSVAVRAATVLAQAGADEGWQGWQAVLARSLRDLALFDYVLVTCPPPGQERAAALSATLAHKRSRVRASGTLADIDRVLSRLVQS